MPATSDSVDFATWFKVSFSSVFRDFPEFFGVTIPQGREICIRYVCAHLMVYGKIFALPASSKSSEKLFQVDS